MTHTEPPAIGQIQELLAEKGYEVAELNGGLIRARDPETGIPFSAALEGNVLFMSVTLVSVPASAVTAGLMQKMLSADNGISTSSFKLMQNDGKTAVTLNNFCTLQNMGEEDKDDVLSLAGYLMADLLEARELLAPLVDSTHR